ncbi:CpsD/CapB family tyrosine-protein kinase [Cohnella abietis]|uniref:non-specific protein-tyrosine kinase n=1 Tax=Cohnella abietis TaxID=2507935 RepID=A0A3T1D124_9BACL|nr:CpsD/CapB family tyrosine-protein kinase [Cohnella abietis]BBI31800.1 tyrosine protein kinase [Cohnella abietis]
MLRSAFKNHLIREDSLNIPASEAYKVLRTNIEFSNINASIQTIMIASTQKGEGKSVTSANLAATYAKSNKKVLLIDANLRNPLQHQIFNLSNSLGLSTLLSNQSELREITMVTDIKNLSVIPSGPLLANPPEALGSYRMLAFLEEAKQLYDIIIIDTPPILSVADAQIVAAQCDGVLLIVKAGKVSKEALTKAKAVLDLVGVKVMGAVLNNVNAKRAAFYSAY